MNMQYLCRCVGCIFMLRAHLCSTKRLLHTKVLDFQGLFVFLGKKTPLSPLYLFLILIGLNLWQLYRKILKPSTRPEVGDILHSSKNQSVKIICTYGYSIVEGEEPF